jgi:hypothetical protein
MVFAKTVRWLRKRLDRNDLPIDSQAATLAGYYTKAMNLFHALEIDVESKPVEAGRLYHMMLLYLDHDEAICPAAARTTTLAGFLDSLGCGWTMPPTSAEVSKQFAEEVDGYLATQISRNHLGMKTIHDEIRDAIAKFNAKHSS